MCVVKVMVLSLGSPREGGLQPGEAGYRELELSSQQPLGPRAMVLLLLQPPISRMPGTPETVSGREIQMVPIPHFTSLAKQCSVGSGQLGKFLRDPKKFALKNPFK